mgnify:CR=1 FL=1
MKKTILAGLAALTMNCAAPQIAGVAPWQAENSSRESFLYRGIEIEGLGWRTTKIMQALNLIYYRDPQNWLAVEKNIKKIRYNPPSGMRVYSGIFDTNANDDEDYRWVGGEIVHDAWHREYYLRNEVYNGREGEKKCMERQNEFFWRIGYPLVNIEQILETRYWESQNRWW